MPPISVSEEFGRDNCKLKRACGLCRNSCEFGLLVRLNGEGAVYGVCFRLQFTFFRFILIIDRARYGLIGLNKEPLMDPFTLQK